MSIKTETYTKDRQLSSHFALHEFKCKESNTIKYSEETIELLEKIFKVCSKISKAIITSGYRTPEYSGKVGGTKDDGHTVGIAVDIKFYDKQNHIIPPKYIACAAQDIGFTGIGIMNNEIHLDTRTTANYKNGKWWGDERNGKNNITNFYTYFELTRDEVNEVLGRKDKIDVIYQVWNNVREAWLSQVKNVEDYAGIYGQSICAVFAELSEGNIYYKVHTKGLFGRWLPEVKNREDYAGILGKPIDAVMLRTDTGKKIWYSVHLKDDKRWLPYVCGYNEKDKVKGFAGLYGKEIDAIRMYIE